MKIKFFLILSFILLCQPARAQGDPQAQLTQFLLRAERSYQALENYKALFIKIEREDGELGEEERIYLQFEKPWKIFMKWMTGRKRGLQVAYGRGQHNNKLMIHKPGLLLGLGPSVIYLEQDSPWVREGSASYNIEDAGIGTFLEDFTEAVKKSQSENKLKVEWIGENFSEVTFLDSIDDEIYFAYRVKVFFDAQTALPVKMELFDWENEPTGIYEYRDLELNTGQDAAFQKEINRSLLRAYNSHSRHRDP